MDVTRIESSICRLVVRGTVHFSNVSSAAMHTATALPASVASREDTREWTVEREVRQYEVGRKKDEVGGEGWQSPARHRWQKRC